LPKSKTKYETQYENLRKKILYVNGSLLYDTLIHKTNLFRNKKQQIKKNYLFVINQLNFKHWKFLSLYFPQNIYVSNQSTSESS